MSLKTARFAPMVPVVAAVAMIGWVAGAGAQTSTEPTPPPLPPAMQDEAPQQADTPPQQQTVAPPVPSVPSTTATATFPALPIGRDGVRDVQNQLIALGFEPGVADGEAGPATLAAARQYNESRGGNGPVPIDGALLARLQQDTGSRLTPGQVAARAQPRYQARAPAASNPIAGAMQQLESNLRGLFNGN